MKRLKNMLYLLNYAWQKCRILYLTTTLRHCFGAVVPLINVVGLGAVVDALTTEKPRSEVIQVILYYLLLNLAISVFTKVFELLDNNAKRRASDMVQLDYVRDGVYINYHYAQDGSVLDMKKKTAGGHPAWFFSDAGRLLQYMVQFVGIITIFASLSPFFMLIILATSSVSVWLSFRRETLEFEFRNARVPEDRKLDYLYKTMSDYRFGKEVRINRADGFIANKYQKILKDQMDKLAHFMNRNIRISMVTSVITVIQSLAMYLYFSYQVFAGRLSMAEYTVLIGNVTLLVSILTGFFRHIAYIRKTLDRTELFRQYEAYVKANSNISAGTLQPMPTLDPENLNIAFENVSFTYPEAKQPTLQKISFTIKQGEKIGIVGLNGSGKTTLIKLLCRLYDPTEGRITLNGIDIKEIPHHEYTKMIGIVLQDFVLFAYPVWENIVFDAHMDETRLMSSIEKSGLSEKIHTLPEGINTSIYKILDDHGMEFSGGEGQKLAFARAIYKKAGVLILDEPTSALDPIAEYELFARLSQVADGKTTIFISHRLSSTKFCDRIFVLSHKGIAEMGSHKELMQKGGLYARLFEAQAKYYERTTAHS